MRTITLGIGILLLIANILFGLILTPYSAFNCMVTSGIIIMNMAVMYAVSAMTLKDGYRIAFNTLFPILFFVEFIAGLFSPERFENNYTLILIVLLLLIQGSVLVITNIVSKIN